MSDLNVYFKKIMMAPPNWGGAYVPYPCFTLPHYKTSGFTYAVLMY